MVCHKTMSDYIGDVSTVGFEQSYHCPSFYISFFTCIVTFSVG